MADLKVDGWLKRFLKLKQEQLHAIGVRSFEPLGCGHYGCVLLHDDARWVVKVTRDPTEGPIAAKVTELRNTHEAALRGIVLFKEIYKAEETVEWRGKTWPVYVTVRESVKPFTWQDADKMRRYRVKTGTSQWGDPIFAAQPALVWMKEAAWKWHELKTPWKKDKAREDYIEWAQRVGDDFPYIGETLFELLDEDIVLRDVHAMNLGYTTWEGDEAHDYVWRPEGTVVIHDLGHTPTDPGEAQFKPLGTFPYVPGIGIPGVPFVGTDDEEEDD